MIVTPVGAAIQQPTDCRGRKEPTYILTNHLRERYVERVLQQETLREHLQICRVDLNKKNVTLVWTWHSTCTKR